MVGAMSMAQRERQALAATMAEVGPQAPTLCGTWTVRDLAAHLIVRERRPDAILGIMLKPLAGYLDSVQAKVGQRPFPDLLHLIRSGPPWYSPMRPFDSVLNLSEMFVHHEDVRRAQAEWQPREISTDDQAHLWNQVRRMGRFAYRKSPVTVVLVTPEGQRVTAHQAGEATVVLTGAPSELLLHAFGRNAVHLDAEGAEADVQAVYDSDRSI